MKDVNKALSLIESTYGKQGPVCYAISQFLKSDNGKAELGETSAKAWLTERLKGVSVNAFYNAVRRYEESLLTPEEKETKKATAQAERAKKKAEQKAKEDSIPADFSAIELGLRSAVKGWSIDQLQTVQAIVAAELTRKEKAMTAEAAKQASKAKAVPTGKTRVTAANGSASPIAQAANQ